MKTTFTSAISEITEVPTGNSNNPLLTMIKFIFADNQGNTNNQGVDTEEFDNIIASSANMPIKMLFADGDVGGHPLSMPIGHIIDMQRQDEETISRLVASAVLYKQEFPTEIEFLKEKFAEGEAPGISWELAYKDSVKKDGIEWLKQVITAAATFVKHPAYGSRTALLAIASNAAASSDEQVMGRLEEILDLWKKDANLPTGGMNVDELEKAKKDLQEAQEKITTLEAEITAKNTELSTVKASNETLAQENAGHKKENTINTRTAKYVQAGFTLDADDDKKKAKIERWLSMSDEEFDGHLVELQEIVASAKSATASAGSGLPRLGGEGNGLNLSFAELKDGLRKASRGEQAIEAE